MKKEERLKYHFCTFKIGAPVCVCEYIMCVHRYMCFIVYNNVCNRAVRNLTTSTWSERDAHRINVDIVRYLLLPPLLFVAVTTAVDGDVVCQCDAGRMIHGRTILTLRSLFDLFFLLPFFFSFFFFHPFENKQRMHVWIEDWFNKCWFCVHTLVCYWFSPK